MKVPILSELKSRGENPEYLFWIGCAGSFDDRAKKKLEMEWTLLFVN